MEDCYVVLTFDSVVKTYGVTIQIRAGSHRCISSCIITCFYFL